MAASITWAEASRLTAVVRRRLLQTDVVLDIGCGIRPQTLFRPRVHLCVEPHLPYIEQLRSRLRKRHRSRFLFLNCRWDAALKCLSAGSVDTVVALDVIEHFDKADGLAFLAEAARVARRQIVIGTPLGFYAQSYEDSDQPDRWGLDGGHWQTHRSGWEPADFGDGWECIGCRKFYYCDGDGRPFPEPIGKLWAVRTLAREGARVARWSCYMPCAQTWAETARRWIPAGLRHTVRSTLFRHAS